MNRLDSRLDRTFYRSAVAWTAIGLAGGLGYREITKTNDFHGLTQLGVVHTHALVLGTTFFLLMLVLRRVGLLAAGRAASALPIAWNAGLAITVTMLSVKGFGQVTGASWADAKAIAGISGLGHMTLTAALICLLVAVGGALKTHAPNATDATSVEAEPEAVRA